jgi:hypothetical protein
LAGAIDPEKDIEARDVQSLKVSYPIVVTPLPIDTEVREVHEANPAPPIEVTLSGIVTEVKDRQFLKALSPMVTTLSGMDTDVTAEDANAPPPMATVGYPPSVDGIDTAPPSPR